MKNNLVQRSITGILFVAALIGCMIGGACSFGVLFLLITILSVREFCKLANTYEPNVNINIPLCMIGGGVLFASFFLYQRISFAGLFIPYLLIILCLLISELYQKKANPVHNWAYSMLSQVYIALPFSLLNLLAFDHDMSHAEVSYSYVLPLSLFIFTWVNDTGAYAIGVTLGKHRLFERISPKKSWEGSIGGAVFSVVAAIILAHFYPIMNTLQWIFFALVVVVFGTWGDLCESLMKRHWGIKDSGTILPGHGGMLDRFDSTLLAIPAVLLYLLTLTLFC